MNRISDFKLAASAIRKYCRSLSAPFIDLKVDFAEEDGVRDNCLYVGRSNTLDETMYKIVNNYLTAIERISGQVDEQPAVRDSFLIHFASTMKESVHTNNVFKEGVSEQTSAQRLYQRPLTWILMKNLICPVNSMDAKNILVLCGVNQFIDVARFYKDSMNNDKLPKEPFIYVNHAICNPSIVGAHSLVAAIEAHGLNPVTTIRELFESDLYQKLEGTLKMAFEDNREADEFIAVLFNILDLKMSDYPHVLTKIAQESGSQNTNPMMWWYLGLTEKMLDPVRGPDWKTREALQGYVEEFWDQVNSEKKASPNGDGLSFNKLLRMKTDQTVDNPNETRRTIQDLLTPTRIL